MKQPPKTRRGKALGAITGAVLIASTAACSWGGGGGGGGDPVPDTGAISATIHVPTKAPKCTGQISWVFTPKHLTGTGGTNKEFGTGLQTYDVSGLSGTCRISGAAMGLQKGTWLVSTSHGDSCEVDVQGLTTVVFKRGVPGCTSLP